MIIIASTADMARALASAIDTDLKRLLALRRDQLSGDNDCDLAELARFVIAESFDPIAAMEVGAGVPLAGESPWFEWVEDHGTLFEAVTITNDDGFAVVLLVPDKPGVDPDLLRLMRDHA